MKSEERSLCEQHEERSSCLLTLSVGLDHKLLSGKHPWEVAYIHSDSAELRTCVKSLSVILECCLAKSSVGRGRVLLEELS